MTRAEYITCIAKTYDPKVAWCGRNISMETSFQNIDHAKRAVAQGSRLTICPECWTMKVTEGKMKKVFDPNKFSIQKVTSPTGYVVGYAGYIIGIINEQGLRLIPHINPERVPFPVDEDGKIKVVKGG